MESVKILATAMNQFMNIFLDCLIYNVASLVGVIWYNHERTYGN